MIMSAIINFKTNSKDVLAEVLLNKKKKPELAKVYAKKTLKASEKIKCCLNPLLSATTLFLCCSKYS